MRSKPSPVWRRRQAGLAPVWYVVIGAVLVLNAAVVAILLLRPTTAPTQSKPPAPPWTAVLLTDNEIFFGHVKALTSDHIELTNVFFVQKANSSSGTTSPFSIVSLVPNQIQCPQDDIKLNRSNVLYWEDLQDKSFVVQKLNQLSGQPQTCYQPPSTTPTP